MAADHANGRYADAHMFTVGRVLFDKTGEVRRLRQVANRWMKKPLPRTAKAWRGQPKYAVWDHLDSLLDLETHGDPSFPFSIRSPSI